jgi:hypothetical protein
MSILRSKHSGWAPDGRRTPYMGGGSGNAPQQNTTYNTNVPEYARPYVENMLESTQKQIYTDDMAGFRPYRPYSTTADDYFASYSPMQKAAQSETANLQTPGEMGIAGAGSLLAGNQYAQNVTSPQSMQAYMSPYQQGVTDIAKNAAVREAMMAQNASNLGAARQGTYGGARQTLANTERERNLLSNLSNIQAQGSNQAYNQALQSQQFGANLGLQGYGQAAQIGNQRQTADLARINAQNTMGASLQAQEQSKINQQIQDYAIAQQYPFMQLGQMNAMLRGLPLQTQSTQLYQAQPSALQQGIGLAGAAGTFFGGRKEGGAIKEYREGGITQAYAPGGRVNQDSEAVNNVQMQLSSMDVNELREVAAKNPSEQIRQMAGELLAQKEIAAAQTQKSRMSGIAAAGGGLFDTMGMAGGGILAFQEGGFGMVNPEFGGGEDPNRDQNRLDSLQLEKDIEKYNFLKDASPVAAERLLASNPILRDKVTPAAPTVAAAPKPEAKPPETRPPGGAPVDRNVPALTGIKSLEDQMKEQERLMGPNTGNEGLNAKIAKRLADMGKRESQDENAAMRRAFIEFGTTAAPGGIGVAALKGLGTYGDASEASRKVREGMDLELTKMQADIKKGERAEKRGNLDAAAKSYENAENRQLKIAEMQNQIKVAGIQASRSSEFEKQYEAFKNDPVAFDKFRKSLTSQDETAKLNAYKAADAVIAKDPLNFSNKPEDQLKLEQKRQALRAEYLATLSPPSTAAAPAGGSGNLVKNKDGSFNYVPKT